MRRAKIIATIGPATESERALRQLLRAGVDVARFNFSHGTQGWHREVMARLRAAADKLGRPVGLLQDLSGPKLRIGAIAAGPVRLKRGAEFALTTREVTGSAEQVHVPLPELPQRVSVGDRIFLDDGLIELKVMAAGGEEIECRVVSGGLLDSHKGVHLPGIELPIATVTEKDRADLRFGLEAGVDLVAMSFVRRAADLEPLRQIMAEMNCRRPIIAKIEKHEAVSHLDEIIAAADGIMVARGDLGIELPVERVPVLQKIIIEKANRAGKPVITATQMLDSMVRNPRPTRAEVTDVANAVLDGSDAVMLSGETAVGRYPLAAVRMMARVVTQAEASLDFPELARQRSAWPAATVTDAISQATCQVAADLEARAIITCTSTGHTAAMVAKNRPATCIVAVTPDPVIQRQLTLVWGVRPVIASRGADTDALIRNAIEAARAAGMVKDEDRVVITAGVPAGVAGKTNLVKVETVGDYVQF
jgi:pyruvate kinase